MPESELVFGSGSRVQAVAVRANFPDRLACCRLSFAALADKLLPAVGGRGGFLDTLES